MGSEKNWRYGISINYYYACVCCGWYESWIGRELICREVNVRMTTGRTVFGRRLREAASVGYGKDENGMR
jgi:hypothetical protein